MGASREYKVAKVDVQGRAYRIAEPRGSDAERLFGLAIWAMEERGAMDVIALMRTHDPSQYDAIVQKAARLLAASSAGREVARGTLIGSKVDGDVITPASFTANYTQFGRYHEPYIATVWALAEFGFFSVTSAKEPEPNETKPEVSPDGDGKPPHSV